VVKITQKKRKQANLLRVLKEEILRNERKIEQVQRFADRYDPEHPENSPDYLLEYANIIFEETDHYGFVGEICHQRLRSHTSEPSERSGLEAYSTAVGICLKPHEVVRYINPLKARNTVNPPMPESNTPIANCLFILPLIMDSVFCAA